MPGSDTPLDYLDANVLLAYVQNEDGRAGIIDDLFQNVRDGTLRLCTSVLSIVEVAYVTTDGSEPDDDLSAIEELWTPASPITLVDISEALARRARTLLRAAKTAGWRLRPADSIHLASAVLAGALQLLTYEKASVRTRWTDLVRIPVREPASDRLPFS